MEDLVSFTSFSGFSSVEDWWAQIKHFTPDESLPLYLYKIEYIKKED